MRDRAILRVNLLGGFRVAVGDRPIAAATWRQRRAAAVVKLLALDPTHRLHREQVLEALWPDLDAAAGAKNLRVALHHAREYLAEGGAAPGAFLVREGASLLLGPREGVSVDVDAFESAVARAWRSADLEAAEAALERYAGDLLPEDPYDEWAERRRAGLRASYLALLARLAHLAEQRGDVDRAVAAQRRILAVEPAVEEAHAALMRLFALAGRRTEALAQYRQLLAVLEREVGVAPEPSTRALHEAIRDDRFPERVPTPVTAAGWTNLPAPVDALIGREREVAETCQLLATARLVTLTGPGGVGKTRLALAVARGVALAFPDGVCFVDLAPIRDPSRVSSAIAQALGVHDTGSQPQGRALAAALREKRLLLLLDNFEQVAEAAPIVARLLGACPGLRALITSRVRLRVSGERERTVPPLGLVEHDARPSVVAVAQSEAGRLFVERAQAVRREFALADENASAVAAICRRLDGLPLAIELAAARSKVLPPASLLARLEKSLPLLTGGGRDLPERQRTMRGTIAWSFDLLSPAEQALFRRLGVFVGGCTLEAVEAVAIAGTPPSEVLEAVASLVDKSLLRAEDGPNIEPRFAMLETVREFAQEQLAARDEEADVRGAHAAFFQALAEGTAPLLRGADARTRLAGLEREYGNMRAALAWFDQTRAEGSFLRLAAALATFWSENCHWVEGNAWLERALVADPRPSPARVGALAALGENAGYLGDVARAETALREGIALARQMGATAHAAYMLQSLGAQRLDRGAYVEGGVILTEALDEARRAGDREVEALSLAHLGAAAWGRGERAEAAARLQAAQALARETGHPVPAEVAARYLGLIATQVGDLVGAAHWYREASTHDPAETQVLVRMVPDVASLAMAGGDTKVAARLFGAAAALADTIGFAPSWPERAVHDRARGEAREALGGDFDTAFEAGRHLPLAEVLAMAEVVLDAASVDPPPRIGPHDGLARGLPT